MLRKEENSPQVDILRRETYFLRTKKYFETPRTDICSSIPPRMGFPSSDLCCEVN